jgi:hypothetical protein
MALLAGIYYPEGYNDSKVVCMEEYNLGIALAPNER